MLRSLRSSNLFLHEPSPVVVYDSFVQPEADASEVIPHGLDRAHDQSHDHNKKADDCGSSASEHKDPEDPNPRWVVDDVVAQQNKSQDTRHDTTPVTIRPSSVPSHQSILLLRRDCQIRRTQSNCCYYSISLFICQDLN